MFYRYYSRSVFEHELQKLGVDRSSCSERQAVEALEKTNRRLNGQYSAQDLGKCTAYAGPQCFSQVCCTAKHGKGTCGPALVARQAGAAIGGVGGQHGAKSKMENTRGRRKAAIAKLNVKAKAKGLPKAKAKAKA